MTHHAHAHSEALLARIKSGDREAAAEFLLRYRTLIERRLRGRLSGQIRTVWDSDDLFASVGRRLDTLVLERRIAAVSTVQLLQLVVRIGENALNDHHRRLPTARAREQAARLRTAMAEQSAGGAAEIPLEPGAPGQLRLARALAALRNETDREILLFWLYGKPLNHIAALVNLTPATLRKRWQSIRGRLRDNRASWME